MVFVTAAQGGKTDLLFDVIGHRMDQSPCPILYVGPTSQFLKEQFEPRLMTMLDESPRLADKVQRGKRMTKTRKVINGNPLRLAHAGSSTALKSDPANVAIVDEVDDLIANTKGQGSPIGLVEARGTTVADFCMLAVSTCSSGPSETEVEPESGLEFWRPVDPKVLPSTIWRMYQAGTMGHWAVPCPECSRYFIPRFSCVEWPGDLQEVGGAEATKRKLTVKEIEREAFLRCPNRRCQAKIYDRPNDANLKAEMNRRGVYVCPGQSVTLDGEVVGPEPENDTASFWASGLMSPFVTVGERAAAYAEAARSGSQGDLQTVINAGFGELFYPRGGDAPEWQEVAAKREPYRFRDVPLAAFMLTMGVDVQKAKLFYTIRAWGRRQESWLVEHGELIGLGRPDETSYNEVWMDLYDLVTSEIDGLPIRMCFIDSGFRPGKPFDVPEHKIYQFCRSRLKNCRPTKGRATQAAPLMRTVLDTKPNGSRASAYGVDLIKIDTDWAKSWVHERIRWPEDVPGGWHISIEASEDYCRQVVSESRARKFTGGYTWIASSKNNHYLDTEALAFAAAFQIGVQRISDNQPNRDAGERDRRRREGSGGGGGGGAPPAINHDPHLHQEVEPVKQRFTMSDLNKKRGSGNG